MSGTQFQVKLTTTAIAWRDHIFAWESKTAMDPDAMGKLRTAL